MDGPAGYLITFTCYGQWLHGDARGSTERDREAKVSSLLEANPARERMEGGLLKTPPFALDGRGRKVVTAAIEDVCEFRGWHLHALNIRTNHVHAVVYAPTPPETVMNSFKAWSTRRLREAGLVTTSTRVWTRHGSTRYLWRGEDVGAAVAYVLDGQGVDLGGVRSNPDTE